MCRVSQWQWHYTDDLGLHERAGVSCETDWYLAKAMPSFPTSWPHERILGPRGSFHFSTSIGYILPSFLQSPPRHIHFQVQGMPWKEKWCFPFPQNSFSIALLKVSDWAVWSGTKPATQAQGLQRLVTTLPCWATSPDPWVSALCSLFTENASLERRGRGGLMFEECRTRIKACGN